MFISVLELFKIGIGPSSSHTMGPMMAALAFRNQCLALKHQGTLGIRCTLKGSLAFTGKGHATHYAVTLGLNGYTPESLMNKDVQKLVHQLWQATTISVSDKKTFSFSAEKDIIFDYGKALAEHPNGMIFSLYDSNDVEILGETYFSIGGGFIHTKDEISQLVAPLKMQKKHAHPYPFSNANAMLSMAKQSGLSIAQMKRTNEHINHNAKQLNALLDNIWVAMQSCIKKGLNAKGILPGSIKLQRRAYDIHQKLLKKPASYSTNDWLCAYAMAVNEENAAGHMVVTAPTNGAAGVIPAVLYYWTVHQNGTQEDIYTYLLTASAIGGLIKHNSSISGAEVGCQGEVGSASAMAAAGLCAVLGGTPTQIENAAEIALEHHLGMTCDPVAGLVQIPCIERNGFGAIKAYSAASLAMHGTGQHFVSLDQCIATMKQTGYEMSEKFKETSQGGLAVNITEC